MEALLILFLVGIGLFFAAMFFITAADTFEWFKLEAKHGNTKPSYLLTATIYIGIGLFLLFAIYSVASG